VPSFATILNTQMKLYYYSASNGGSGSWVDRWVQAHQILVNWNETQATRDNRLTGTPWNVAYVGLNDIDAKSTYESTILFQSGQTNTWKSWDITALTQKWVNGTATNYGVVLWATNEATDGYDLRFRSSEYATTTERPYLQVTYSTSSKTVYFLKDHLGSIRATVDNTGAVVGYDDYDPWGYILANRSLATPWSSVQGTAKNKFTGKEFDDDFGLNWGYHIDRYYDSQIGRWWVVDPIQQHSLSPYVYAANNPLIIVDPFGADTVYVDWPDGKRTAHYIPDIVVEAERQDPFQDPASGVLADPFLDVEDIVGFGKAIAKGVAKIGGPILVGALLKKAGKEVAEEAIEKVPKKAKGILKFIKQHHGSPPPGYKGGKIYKNTTGKLPQGGKYKEYDVDPKVQGMRRTAERIVVDENTGRAWYTPDHYNTFIEIK
jgi:ribonuclease T1